MLRKTLSTVSALAVALGVLVASGGQASAAAPVDASGTLHCAIAGKIKIAPKITFSGSTPGGSLFQAKIKATGCTGSSGVTSVKGNLTARLDPNNCTALATQPFPAAAFGPVKWKGVGKYTGSTVNFTAGGTFTTTDPITVSLPGGGTSSVASGSFVGQQPTITLVLNESVATLAGACGPKQKGVKPSGGLKKLSFGGASNLDIP